MVVRFNGMLVLSAKCPRPPGKEENSWESHGKVPKSFSEHLVECHPISTRDQSRIHQQWLIIIGFLQKTAQDSTNVVRKFFQECSSDFTPTRSADWRVNTVFIFTSLKTEIARSARGPK